MPCPFFEPLRVVTDSKQESGRLPLIDEYAGQCRAAEVPVTVPDELRFRACNHGYSRPHCTFFPASQTAAAIRFDVVAREGDSMELLCVEERDYAPYRWSHFRYSIESGAVEPQGSGICLQAQLRAFCTSYIQRFSA